MRLDLLEDDQDHYHNPFPNLIEILHLTYPLKNLQLIYLDHWSRYLALHGGCKFSDNLFANTIISWYRPNLESRKLKY